MIYLRRTGRRFPDAIARENLTDLTVWSVRDAGTVVGFVSHASRPVSPRERARAFRGYSAAGTPVTPLATDRTDTRNRTASRRDWT